MASTAPIVPPPAPVVPVVSMPPAPNVPGLETVVVTGCRDTTVGPIIRGNFTRHSENHAKPVYRRNVMHGELDVMLYYWHDDDNPGFCGWWFGPRVGGDQVWAFNPGSGDKPPSKGWQVPFDGAEDSSVLLAVSSANSRTPGGGGKPTPAVVAPPAMSPGGAVQQQLEASMGALVPLPPPAAAVPAPPVAYSLPPPEQEHKTPEQQKRAREQHAVLEIKRVVARVKVAKPENIESLTHELEQVLAREAEAAGPQRQKVEDEAAKALAQAKQRVEQITAHQKKLEEARAEAERQRLEQLEAERRKAEELKAEEERLLKERMEEAKRRMEEQRAEEERRRKEREEAEREFEEAAVKLISVVEDGAKEIVERSQRLDENDVPSEDVVKDAEKESNDITEAASKSFKEAIEFLRVDPNSAMKAVHVLPETRYRLRARLEAAGRSMEMAAEGAYMARMRALDRAEQKRLAAERVAAATKVMDKRRELFKTYDKDGDGHLNQKEIIAFAQGEYSFELLPEALDRILRVVVRGNPKGVSFEKFHELRVSVGIWREVARDIRCRREEERRKEEVERERESLKEDFSKAAVAIQELDTDIVKAEAACAGLNDAGDELNSTELTERLKPAEVSLKAAQAALAAARQRNEDIVAVSKDDDLQKFVRSEAKALAELTDAMKTRLSAAATNLAAYRKRIEAKARTEVDALNVQIVSLLRARMKANGLSTESLLAEISGRNGNTGAGQEDLLIFLRKLWEEGEFPEDTVVRWMAGVVQSGNGERLELEELQRLVRITYKVVKATVMTDNVTVKESTVLRRLELDEIIELADGGEGPVKDDLAGVLRIRGRALKDNLCGYVSLQGNQGTTYLEVGGNRFKVVKETILTDSLSVNGKSDSVRKLKDSVKKLREGAVVEVLEHARKDEDSGLIRMKVKAKDGAVGWATMLGNQGTIFLKVL